MNILIRNLNRTTTEVSLKELFEQFGEVQSCAIVIDKETGGSKGFGFVEMPNDKHAKFAIKKLNDRDLEGKRIRVKVAEKH